MPLRILFGFLALTLVACAAIGQEPPVRVEFDPSPDALLLEWFEDIDEIADDDPAPRVQIWGDGRVAVHVPVYKKRAGDYRLRLSARELTNLLETFGELGIFGFDAAEVRQRMADSRAARRDDNAPLRMDTDGATTTLRVHRTSTRSPSVNQRADAESVEFVWHGLKRDARNFPEIPELAGAAAAIDLLRNLIDDPRLERLPED